MLKSPLSTDIAVFGCGWLGKAFAKWARDEDFSISGSCRNEQGMSALDALGIEPFVFETSPVVQSPWVLIMLPFRRDLEDPRTYLSLIQTVIDSLDLDRVEKVLFTSSTSVYRPSERATVLREAELMIEALPVCSIICRVAGMVGGERDSRRILQKGFFEEGNARVNLIHRDDIVEILGRLLKVTHLENTTLVDLVADEHPTKQAYYTKRAELLSLPTPQFGLSDAGHIVDNQRLKSVLNYEFLYPDPLFFP